MADSQQLKGTLHYLSPLPIFEKEKPYTFYIDPGQSSDIKATNIVTQPIHDVHITNARPVLQELDLDKQGFEVLDLDRRFSIEQFEDEEWIGSVYYPYIEDLIATKLGAKEVHIMAHQLRYRHPGFGDLKYRAAPRHDPPVGQVHADQTEASSLARFQKHWPSYSEELKSDRLRILNLWRPLVEEITEWPLALCDSRSVDPKRDLRPSDLVKEDYIGESYVCTYNPSHSWYYLDKQSFTEGWLFKLYDSKPNVASAVLHTAFDIGASERGRRSCEIRILVRG